VRKNDLGAPVTNSVKKPPKSRTTALQLISRRDYTTAELKERLLSKGCDEREADDAIRALAADGTLDDRRVGAAHVRTAGRVKGRGRLRILRELQARGIDRDLARDLVREVGADDEADSIARILLRRRVPRRPGPEDRRKIFQHLLRRGFPSDAIARALRKHGEDADDPA
jgi:regulatory protein